MRFLAIALLAAALPARAAPYLPQDDSAVLERLPTRRDDPAMAELRRLRAAAAERPQDAEAAARLARRYFEMANAEGDPRYVGYAEAALRPWRSGEAAANVLYIRGLVRQYRHDFAGGLADLAAALERDPDLSGAHAWRAAIFMVQAEYGAAERECSALREQVSELVATGCAAYVDAATGKTRAAYAALSAALERRPDAARETRLWTLTRLAEMAWRLGDAALAERHFTDALGLGVTDNFLLAAYADFLLERSRPKDVVALLQDWVRSDTLLLRLAIAERRLGHAAAEAHAQALADRFAAAALRGERLHLGEEARFLLELKGDPRRALAVALENWQDQREPRDALIVLEAAAAAKEATAAAPVLGWLRDSGFEDERMRRLAASLR